MKTYPSKKSILSAIREARNLRRAQKKSVRVVDVLKVLRERIWNLDEDSATQRIPSYL